MAQPRGQVLVVEDNREAADLMAAILEEEAFTVTLSSGGGEAAHKLEQGRPAAILLDWVLPDMPGIELCRHVRQVDPLLPVLFVSGRDDEASVVRAFEAGADDYLVKPVRPGELVARLERHLRRLEALPAASKAPPPDGASESVLRAGDVEVDVRARVARVAGEEVRLGSLEFQLLAYFFQNPGIAISRDQILDEVYGFDAEIATDRVDLLVRRVRAKLGEGPRRGAQIVAVPGYGFRLERRLGDR